MFEADKQAWIASQTKAINELLPKRQQQLAEELQKQPENKKAIKALRDDIIGMEEVLREFAQGMVILHSEPRSADDLRLYDLQRSLNQKRN